MTTRRLRALCRTWQKRLRLQDWRITADLATQEQMGQAEGKVEYDETEQVAHVYILRGLPPERAEETLIHELLHLRLARLHAKNDTDKEMAINLLADSLRGAYTEGTNA
jgi:hypothetical protein